MLKSVGTLDAMAGLFPFRQHPEPWWCISLLQAGGIEWVINGHELTTAPISVMLLAPETPYQLEARDSRRRWHTTWARFTPPQRMQAWLQPERFTDGYRFIPLPDMGPGEEIAAAMNRLVRLASAPCRSATESAFLDNVLEQALLQTAIVHEKNNDGRYDWRVDAAIEFMQTHPTAPLQLADVASKVGCSTSRLTHLFTEQLGIPPMRFLERYRLELARNLLSGTNLTVREVAARTGYQNAFYLSNRFRRHTGLSPTAYRASCMSADIDRPCVKT